MSHRATTGPRLPHSALRRQLSSSRRNDRPGFSSLRAQAFADERRRVMANPFRIVGSLLADGGAGDRHQAAITALGIFSTRIGGAAIAYGSQILLARMMGSFEYGIFAVVWVWVVMVSSI